MSQKFYKVSPDVPLQSHIGANSEVFASADPVAIDADGFLIVATAGIKVLGYATDDVTMTSTNESVAKVKVNYVPAVHGVQMQYTADQACTDTDLGAYADLSGTTGAIAINLAAGDNGQFLVLAYDPEEDGSTTEVVVEAAERQTDAYAQV